MHSFKLWLAEDYQRVFPFMMEDDPPNLKKMQRYKDKESYIKAMSRGGRDTEGAAEKIIREPIGGWFKEEILEIKPKAVVIPAFTFPNGVVRPERYLAFVYIQSTKPINPEKPEYNKKRYRILAYYQGAKENFTKDDIEYGSIVGGLMGFGGYITHVWVDKEYRGDSSKFGIPNLYKLLLQFARQRGIVGLAPEKATCPNCGETVGLHYEPKKCPNCNTLAQPLTSKSFRAAQARYDWKRGHDEKF